MPEGECSKQSNMAERACVSGLLQNSHPEKYTVRFNSNTFLPLISIFPVILFLFQENGLS